MLLSSLLWVLYILMLLFAYQSFMKKKFPLKFHLERLIFTTQIFVVWMIYFNVNFHFYIGEYLRKHITKLGFSMIIKAS